MYELIGKRVQHVKTKEIGIITTVDESYIYVTYPDKTVRYRFPDELAENIVLEDQDLQEKYIAAGMQDHFDLVRGNWLSALNEEIKYLKKNGGRKYHAIDGVRMDTRPGIYMYVFEMDSEPHFPAGTMIRLKFQNESVTATVQACEEFSIMIQTKEQLAYSLRSVEFTAEQWLLLDELKERIRGINPLQDPIAGQLACRGNQQIQRDSEIKRSQKAAQKMVSEQPITFVWGPPGTGKTTTLASIALDFMRRGKRVLMLSYSNVSVDGALLKVAAMAENIFQEGTIVRYGYPRSPELMKDGRYTSYQLVLNLHPELAMQYRTLRETYRGLDKTDGRKAEIKKKLENIHTKLRDEERLLIQRAPFVATTVSKAVVDKAVYSQTFDLVIFDEASMAYVPQVVFGASLASERFCCLGDFRQLPAIVQNPENKELSRDIFEYTKITEAVSYGCGHKWLVMLSEQYRMHPDIAAFVSRIMYENLLVSDHRLASSRSKIAAQDPIPKPMGLIDLSGTYSVCVKTADGSRINLLSAMVDMKVAEKLHSNNTIGIVTPYAAQSRLVLAMLRDLSEQDDSYQKSVTSATVHQFQGSEKAVIIYDAVDCYRMPYPGILLTGKKNDTANRLFNVALTRAQGKFLMVVNSAYMKKKRLSKDLMFAKALSYVHEQKAEISGEDILNELGTEEKEDSQIFLGGTDETDSWNRYVTDLQCAKDEIVIHVPGAVDDDPDALKTLGSALREAHKRKVKVNIYREKTTRLPAALQKFETETSYVTTPLTVIDREIVWFGEPLCAADFYTEKEIVVTQTEMCARFQGRHTARFLEAALEIES